MIGFERQEGNEQFDDEGGVSLPANLVGCPSRLQCNFYVTQSSLVEDLSNLSSEGTHAMTSAKLRKILAICLVDVRFYVLFCPLCLTKALANFPINCTIQMKDEGCIAPPSGQPSHLTG